MLTYEYNCPDCGYHIPPGKAPNDLQAQMKWERDIETHDIYSVKKERNLTEEEKEKMKSCNHEHLEKKVVNVLYDGHETKEAMDSSKAYYNKIHQKKLEEAFEKDNAASLLNLKGPLDKEKYMGIKDKNKCERIVHTMSAGDLIFEEKELVPIQEYYAAIAAENKKHRDNSKVCYNQFAEDIRHETRIMAINYVYKDEILGYGIEADIPKVSKELSK